MQTMRIKSRDEFSRRSQVSAPIELFVAVIILAMTLALGMKVLNDVEEGKCIAALKTQTQSLKNAMLDVALGSSGTKKTIYFTFPSCGGKKVEGLQFVLYLDPAYCRLCQGNYGYCWQIVPVARDPDNRDRFAPVSDAISCVNMAGNLQLSVCSSGSSLFSDTPCFKGDPSCTPSKYGLVTSVWDPTALPENQKSKWQTLAATGSRSYYLTLSKTTTLSRSEEQGSIELCAVPS